MNEKNIKIISEKYKDLAHWALKYALNKGCSDVSINIYTKIGNSFEYRNKQLDTLQQSFQNGMFIQLYVSGRFASYSTNKLNKKDLEHFIVYGIETTCYLEKDKFRKLPDISRLYQSDGEGLDIYDENIGVLSVSDKLNLVENNVNEVYNTDKRLISVISEYSDSMSGEYMITSDGFEGESLATCFSLSAVTSMRGKGDTRPSDSWYSSAVFWKDLQKKGIARAAYERTFRKLGQKKIESGVYKILADNLVGCRLLFPLISALYGSAIQQQSSFLRGKIGEKVISDKVTIIDDPHIRRAQGARLFDAEGVATKRMNIIENGILNMYYLDTYYAGKLAMRPTIQSPSILTFKHGNENFEQILSSIEKGIWVTDFNGGNSNDVTGDFSFGIEGFLIENGKAIQPLHEMNVTGNILTLWQNIEKVGNDPRNDMPWQIPSILFGSVCFSGK